MDAARAEEARIAEDVARVQKFMDQERFKYTQRPYDAKTVVSLRGPLLSTPASDQMADKLYTLCRSRFDQAEKGYTHTFGCLDPVQVAQMGKYLECIYVSGWQSSSTASTSNEPGPDFADYPANTVPNKVEQLFKAQCFHARKQQEERSRMTLEEKAANPPTDFLRPIIADGDTGFGGMTSVMKLVKMQIEAGAAGVHIEDQKPGAKKCGHMGGKVLVPVREQIDRMVAARLQADIMGARTVLISRTDAEAANMIENTIDSRDHPYIGGATNAAAGSREDAADVQKWIEDAKIMRYSDCIAEAMQKAGKGNLVAKWMEDSMKMSNDDARKLAASLGFGDVYWNWDAARSREGYYAYCGGNDAGASRAIHFAPVSDLIWMETATPNLAVCEKFAKTVHAVHPHQMFGYNLSPSFNWDASGMSDKEIQSFQADIGRLGFTWQFITLCGFHTNALAIDQIAKAYAGPKGVFAYVEMIQREERRLGVETLTHQKWSGAEMQDKAMNVATQGGSSTSSLHGATEDQFTAKL